MYQTVDRRLQIKQPMTPNSTSASTTMSVGRRAHCRPTMPSVAATTNSAILSLYRPVPSSDRRLTLDIGVLLAGLPRIFGLPASVRVWPILPSPTAVTRLRQSTRCSLSSVCQHRCIENRSIDRYAARTLELRFSASFSRKLTSRSFAVTLYTYESNRRFGVVNEGAVAASTRCHASPVCSYAAHVVSAVRLCGNNDVHLPTIQY